MFKILSINIKSIFKCKGAKPKNLNSKTSKNHLYKQINQLEKQLEKELEKKNETEKEYQQSIKKLTSEIKGLSIKLDSFNKLQGENKYLKQQNDSLFLFIQQRFGWSLVESEKVQIENVLKKGLSIIGNESKENES